MTEQLDEALFRMATAAHPDICADRDAFFACLARVGGAVDDDYVADLYLADACARGDGQALASFDRAFGADIDRAIARSPRLGVAADEFRQLVRERLFVAQAGRPARISGYQGRGPLKSWVRVTVSRLVIDIARRGSGEEPRPADELARQLPAAADPELDVLRHAYGELLPAAFAHGVDALTARQRNLLRQRYLHETTVERLAVMYDVHRSTMFAWLADARQTMLAAVRASLAAELNSGDDLDSIVAVLGSKLDVSVRRMLGSRIEEE